ncbi:MAG: type II toxin-antitoxin system RelE/ParE family toxin [Caldilineaceae bacterium]|nr:type II toxin-antitoxin system RelE/ParE family toxin [Caldilineaceae bacterium]MCP5332668.1 type II toxin-antitoxin system RelE/ParE family toxin [Pseudomonadales bacterium]
MRQIFEPAARKEFADAARWYAAEAGPLHAADFRNEVHHALSLLSDHPAMGTPAGGNTRRMVVHRYPYFIVYRVHAGRLHILALAHQSRRPGYWADRR